MRHFTCFSLNWHELKSISSRFSSWQKEEGGEENFTGIGDDADIQSDRLDTVHPRYIGVTRIQGSANR